MLPFERACKAGVLINGGPLPDRMILLLHSAVCQIIAVLEREVNLLPTIKMNGATVFYT